MKPYWEQRRDQKLTSKTTLDAVKRENKKNLDEFYEEQAIKAPDRCENCGNPLGPTIALHPRGHICHIVPKKLFESVMWHPWNRWFGCIDCHTLFDRSWSRAQLLNIWPTCVERFKKFMHQIAPEERKSLPDPLRKILDDASI